MIDVIFVYVYIYIYDQYYNMSMGKASQIPSLPFLVRIAQVTEVNCSERDTRILRPWWIPWELEKKGPNDRF